MQKNLLLQSHQIIIQHSIGPTFTSAALDTTNQMQQL